jgi:thymidylate synthase
MARNALTFEDAWFTTIDDLTREGRGVGPRGRGTLELTGYSLRVEYPNVPFDLIGRGMRPQIAAIESLGLIGGIPTDRLAYNHSRSLYDFAEDGRFYGSYGVRTRNQLRHVLKKLRDDRSTRQAVMTIYNGDQDAGVATTDLPCTVAIQFLIRDDVLTTIVTMRSNDVWLGMPYDLFQFGALHQTVAQLTNSYVGPYIHQVGSMHLYDNNRDAVSRIPTGKPLTRVSTVEDLWDIDDLEYITLFCQGEFEPNTPFEKYLREALA